MIDRAPPFAQLGARGGDRPDPHILRTEEHTQMNTDWNGPQGDFETTEKQGELLMLLSRQQVTVHTWDDPDFDYMEEQDLALVVHSPSGTEDLLIELCGEFSVFFEKWHGTYKATAAGYAQGGCAEPVYRKRLAGYHSLPGKARRRCRRRCIAGALLEGGQADCCPAPGRAAGAGVLGSGGKPAAGAPGKGIKSAWTAKGLPCVGQGG